MAAPPRSAIRSEVGDRVSPAIRAVRRRRRRADPRRAHLRADVARGPHRLPRIVHLPRIADPRGNLTMIESNAQVPFDIRRVYYLYDVPGGEVRGGHAHRQLEQFVIAASGSFEVLVDDGVHRERFFLNRSYFGLYMPPHGVARARQLLERQRLPRARLAAVRRGRLLPRLRRVPDRRRRGPRRDASRSSTSAAATREIAAEQAAAIARVVDGGWYVLGPEVERVRGGVRRASAARAHAVGVGNGLDALRLILQALGIGPGDEVIVPSHTYIATWLAHHRGGRDAGAGRAVRTTCSPSTPPRSSPRSAPRTAAIMPVHLYGQPADDGRRSQALAARHGLALVEDAAQAHGARLARPARRRLRRRRRPGASTRRRTSARSATPAPSRPTTPRWRARLRRLRNYGSERSTSTSSRARTAGSTSCRPRSCRSGCGTSTSWNARRAAIAARYARRARRRRPRAAAHGPPGADRCWHLYVVRSPRATRSRRTSRAGRRHADPLPDPAAPAGGVRRPIALAPLPAAVGGARGGRGAVAADRPAARTAPGGRRLLGRAQLRRARGRGVGGYAAAAAGWSVSRTTPMPSRPKSFPL